MSMKSTGYKALAGTGSILGTKACFVRSQGALLPWHSRMQQQEWISHLLDIIVPVG